MQHWELIAKLLRNEASQEEIAIVNSWIKESSENEKLFLEIKKIWESSPLNTNEVFDKATAWSNIQNKIKTETKVIPLNPTSKSSFTIFLRIAAVLVISLFATWGIYTSLNSPDQLSTVTHQNRTELKLADGSTVWLNSNSSLNYPEFFSGNDRTVQLNGEAYFEITKNPDMPFIIENTEFMVKVLGTSFNIFSYDKDDEIVISVTSGKVSLKNKTNEEILLTKGETGVLNRNTKTLSKKENTDPNFLSWKEEKLEFNNTPFSSVCTTLKSYFGFDFVVKNNKLNNCRFTASFKKPILEEVLEVLKNTLSIEVVKNQKQVVFSGKGC